MGMAASQARLLSITARIHDVEYQAQSIQNAKVQLATQSDQVYNDYMEALDAQTLTISILGADGSKSRIAANFNNLFSSNKAYAADGSNYALRESKTGHLVVEDAVYNAYEQFKGKDPYAFAIYMLNNDVLNTDGYGKNPYEGLVANTKEKEEAIYQKKLADGSIVDTSDIASLRNALQEYVGEGNDIYDGSNVPEDKQNKYEAALDKYRYCLYKQYGEDICTSEIDLPNMTANDASMSESQFDHDKLNYYIGIFNQIEMCGGCIPISDYNGMFGCAANNGEWLTSMIQSAKFTIDIVSRDKNGKYTMNGTSPSSDTCLSYTEVSSIDNTAVKKAEAKYEKDLKEIDKKDKQYDLTLSKLETERTALTTEYDSVKKVIQDNIDRTFGIFS